MTGDTLAWILSYMLHWNPSPSASSSPENEGAVRGKTRNRKKKRGMRNKSLSIEVWRNLWVRTHPSLKTSSSSSPVGFFAKIGAFTHAGSSLRVRRNEGGERRRKERHTAAVMAAGGRQEEEKETMKEEGDRIFGEWGRRRAKGLRVREGGGRFWCYKGEEGFVWFGVIRVVYDNL